MTTEELIEALEKAEGPSRELDEEITRVAIWRNKVDRSVPVDRPRYTASIDAALTLVPEQYDMISFRSDPSGSGWELGEFTGGEYIKHSEGSTDGLWAIALCIAALRART